MWKPKIWGITPDPKKWSKFPKPDTNIHSVLLNPFGLILFHFPQLCWQRRKVNLLKLIGFSVEHRAFALRLFPVIQTSKEQLHAAWCDGELVAFRERVFIFWETVPIASGLPGGPQGTQSLKELWQAHMRACRPQVRTPREQFIFTTLQTVSVGVSIGAWKTSVWQTPCLQSLQEHDRMPDLWPDMWHWVSHLTTKNFIVCGTKWRPKVT